MTLRILTSHKIESDFNSKMMNFNNSYKLLKMFRKVQKNHYPVDSAIQNSPFVQPTPEVPKRSN